MKLDMSNPLSILGGFMGIAHAVVSAVAAYIWLPLGIISVAYWIYKEGRPYQPNQFMASTVLGVKGSYGPFSFRHLMFYTSPDGVLRTLDHYADFILPAIVIAMMISFGYVSLALTHVLYLVSLVS